MLPELNRRIALQKGAEEASNKFRAKNPDLAKLHDDLEAELCDATDPGRRIEIIDQLENLDPYIDADIPAAWASQETEHVRRKIERSLNSTRSS